MIFMKLLLLALQMVLDLSFPGYLSPLVVIKFSQSMNLRPDGIHTQGSGEES